LVAAAVLHDTVEDTATLLGELASIFNADIAGLVAEATATTSDSIKRNGKGFKSSMRAQKRHEQRFSN
jgi:(p)ppGpp synthase/HD superfamily hydrolase